MYYFPSAPASTAGMICGNVEILGPYVPSQSVGAFSLLDPSDAKCTSFLARWGEVPKLLPERSVFG